MANLRLKFTLKSDATFGRGDGIASLIDSEVQHDEYGLPFLGGRSLKGLLEEECASIIFALEKQGKDGEFKKAAQHLFGNPGSRDSDKAILHVGDARLDMLFKIFYSQFCKHQKHQLIRIAPRPKGST